MENKAVKYGIACSLVVLLGRAPVAFTQTVASGAQPEPTKSASVSMDVVEAPLRAVLQAIARQAGLRPVWDNKIIDSDVRVTLHVRQMSADEAFARALSGTGMRAVVMAGRVVILEDAARISIVYGSIAGNVLDPKTKYGMRGVAITVDDNTIGTVSGDDGTFRIANVAPGQHTVYFRRLGYVRVSKAVSVVEGQTALVDVAMEPSPNMLDQIVVTGMVVQTARKAVPNAMTVITAQEIEERGITKIDQLFRGDVPGVFVVDQGSINPLDAVAMFSRGATKLGNRFIAASSTNPIKTYVDGVELADPQYLSQIDPKSIERIEILTGPQASTIYGSNAINGVMQIFTKRGATSRPRVTLSLLSGLVENNFSTARTPQHDYSAQIDGAEGRMAYNIGGSWNYIGPWTPAKQTTRTSLFGGTRLDLPSGLGRVTTDMTFRHSNTENRQRGDTQQGVTENRKTGFYIVSSTAGLSVPTTSTLEGQTLGLTVQYVPTSWWSHELGIGQDVANVETRSMARGNLRPSDTTLSLSQTLTNKRSLRYATTARVPVTSLAEATVTVGADAWQRLTSSMSVSPQTLTGTLTGTTSLSRQPGHNTGVFLQAQLGIQDKLFVTYGFRGEWNPDYGKEAEPNYAPRYGVAYTREIKTPFGLLTAKLRGSYGRSTRPPLPSQKVAMTLTDIGLTFYVPDYGNFAYYAANPALAPEHQQGGEGGLELYLGTRGSLVVTRYNQTVDGLIAAPAVDSVRSLTTTPSSWNSRDVNGYGYLYQLQYLNIGSIRNQGWEMQGTVTAGLFTTRLTYSWVKSRTIGVSPQYKSYFSPNSYPQYQPGATFGYVPEHTWALGTTYSRPRTTVTLNVSGRGALINGFDEFNARNLYSQIRLQGNQLRVSGTAGYTNVDGDYATADITVMHGVSSSMDAVLQVQNVTNRYTDEYGANLASIGRQLKAGFRARLQ